LVYLLVLLCPNSYTVLFWEFCLLPFSVHVQTNVMYVTLLFRYGALLVLLAKTGT
jgi:hypothetical protein